MGKPRQSPRTPSAMKIVDLKSHMPLVQQALVQMDRELAVARQQGYRLVKLIHGYGSTGVGGEIRIAVQKRLRELNDQGQVQAYIYGENWAPSDEQTWTLTKANPGLKEDRDLGRKNQGITVVVL